VSVSQLSKNKKLLEVLHLRDVFVEAVEKERAALTEEMHFHAGEAEDRKVVEGGDISVCVRIRPLLNYEAESGFFDTVFARNPKVYTLEPRLDVRKNPKTNKSTFEVDYGFGPGHDNDAVYSAITMPLIDLGLKGGVCTLLAYGQTGTGKTHTIGGVLDRLGADLFARQGDELKDGDGNSRLRFHVSFFELLGNVATDLLCKDGKRIEIVEDAFGKIVTRNASEIEVHLPIEFVDVVKRALGARRTETTFKNDTSSRSHAICSIRVENTHFREAEDGKIFVVDLAGMETAADAQFHDKARMDETKLINGSLMALKNCIRNRNGNNKI
jgi:kinesin family protein 2/24